MGLTVLLVGAILIGLYGSLTRWAEEEAAWRVVLAEAGEGMSLVNGLCGWVVLAEAGEGMSLVNELCGWALVAGAKWAWHPVPVI